ncbi:MAG: class I SAM-dependent methyltransferase [Cyanobacteriota/Melainabacteria group bacterium]
MEEKLLQSVKTYFTDKLNAHGPTPLGVDWNTQEAQEIRFIQIHNFLHADSDEFSLVDFGCGYGALLSYLRDRGMNCRYIGYDIVPEMIAQARVLHEADKKAEFICDGAVRTDCDYSVGSGVFNQKGESSHQDWTDYVVENLNTINDHSRKGFAFNFLTSYSDKEKMRADLYYADPCFLFDLCKRNYAKNVAILHDYGAYEFTLIVRKELI